MPIVPNPASAEFAIQRIQGESPAHATDQLAVEEPLEIRIAFGPANQRITKPIAITMRTPTTGHDFELALGFLLSEGIINARADVERCIYCGPETAPLRLQNVVRVELAPNVTVDMARLERHFFTNSSCGICGKTTIQALQTLCPTPIASNFIVPLTLLHSLPEFLRDSQPVFDRTGGLHAAALFDSAGKLIALREDVGRHNALDKLIGSQFRAGALPLANRLLLVSGRASFELLQKTIMAGIPLIAAVGAPSSLAVDLARQFNVTLIGFLRNNRFNLYAGAERLAAPPLPNDLKSLPLGISQPVQK